MQWLSKRAMEMISLRVGSLRNLVTAAENANSSGQLDVTLLLDTSRKWGAALEIWPEVLAESNSLDSGDLDD